MLENVAVQNWVIGNEPHVLENIIQKDISISVYNREIDAMHSEIQDLLNTNIDFRSSGTTEEIITELVQLENFSNSNGQLIEDIKSQLSQFEQISGSSSFRLFLGTVNTNMCRKFHTDINDLRMLCTYSGPGTLWLTEDNINRNALNNKGDENDMVIDESKVRQAEEGTILILKGAIFPQENTKAAVHRSPTIEETGERRLLLRIDTNDFLNF